MVIEGERGDSFHAIVALKIIRSASPRLPCQHHRTLRIENRCADTQLTCLMSLLITFYVFLPSALVVSYSDEGSINGGVVPCVTA